MKISYTLREYYALDPLVADLPSLEERVNEGIKRALDQFGKDAVVKLEKMAVMSGSTAATLSYVVPPGCGHVSLVFKVVTRRIMTEPNDAPDLLDGA